MRKIKLLISYDGTDFLGWQRQAQGASVQATIEAALSKIYDAKIKIVGSGRTDTGVHAVGQVAHFEPPKILAGNGETRLQRALNSLLPDSIAIKGAWEAPEDFHSLFSARRKTYVYRIWNDPTRSALWRNRAVWIPQSLDVDYLNVLSGTLLGEHDFKSFQTSGTPVKSTVRRIHECGWRVVRGPLVEFRIRGNGFLKQMVRNLVGTLLYLERQKSENPHGIKALRAIFDQKDRQAAKGTAPAHGLYLYRVEYPPALDNKCRKL